MQALAQNVTVIPARRRVGSQRTAVQVQKIRVAAYCRVSTDSEEQETSYEAQVSHYTEYIKSKPEWQMVEVYADDGTSGTNTAKRDEFNRMIADCEAGKIDLILTKSISRFSRNTLDCLKYTRKLKALNIAVFFEKENIHTDHNIPWIPRVKYCLPLWLPLHSRNRNPCQPMCEWASSTAISRARCRSITIGS